jgi:sugar-specific transcriptional regulator TrmB
MLEIVLQRIGLSEKEAKVYLATLELAESSVQNIAKKAGVNRPTAYVILEKLMGLGLASTLVKGKKTYFVAQSPSELENILKEQVSEIEHRKSELEGVMSQLHAIYNANSEKPAVRYFEGADGLVSMDRYGRDKLEKNSELLSLTPIDLIEERFGSRRKDSLKERIDLGIKSRAIYTHKDGKIPTQTNAKELREGVFLSRDDFPLTGTISIYPDWGVKFYHFDQSKPHGVVVESKEIAQNMKLLFELAWKEAHKPEAKK